jgi:hypothetical protein
MLPRPMNAILDMVFLDVDDESAGSTLSAKGAKLSSRGQS